MLKNGKRCNNKAIGRTVLKNNKTGEKFNYFIIQCKEHQKECRDKFMYYKNISDIIYNHGNRKTIKKHNICKNKKKKDINELIDLLKELIAKRLEFASSCTNGCLVEPGDNKSLTLSDEDDMMHRHEVITLIKNMIKCRKLK